MKERLVDWDQLGHVFGDHILGNRDNTSIVMSVRSIDLLRRAGTSNTHLQLPRMLQEGLTSRLLGKNIVNHIVNPKDLPILVDHGRSHLNILNI